GGGGEGRGSGGEGGGGGGRRRTTKSAFSIGLSVRVRCWSARTRPPYCENRRRIGALAPPSHNPPKLPLVEDAVPCRKSKVGLSSFLGSAGSSVAASVSEQRYSPGPGCSWLST